MAKHTHMGGYQPKRDYVYYICNIVNADKQKKKLNCARAELPRLLRLLRTLSCEKYNIITHNVHSYISNNIIIFDFITILLYICVIFATTGSRAISVRTKTTDDDAKKRRRLIARVQQKWRDRLTPTPNVSIPYARICDRVLSGLYC